MDTQGIIIILVIIFIFYASVRYLASLDQALHPEPKGIESQEERLKKFKKKKKKRIKKLKKKKEERLKKEKLMNEIINKRDKIYKKLATDYKKWESTIDLKEKEKIWSQLCVQQELYDKLTNLRKFDSDFIEKANLYLKDK